MIYVCGECKKRLVDLTTDGRGICSDFVCDDCLKDYKKIIARQAQNDLGHAPNYPLE